VKYGIDWTDHRLGISTRCSTGRLTITGCALYGYQSSVLNVTDGTYTYHLPCDCEVDAD
jgi:hypothetical protein